MRYPTKKEKNKTIDGEEMEKSQKTSIDGAISDTWMNSKRFFLEEMREMELDSLTQLRNQLARMGIVNRSTRGTKNGNILGISKFSRGAQYSTWFRDHIEHFTTGYANRYVCSFYLQDGRVTRSFMMDGNELNVIFGYLTNNCNYIESQHSKF